jgi:hypothetical protein
LSLVWSSVEPENDSYEEREFRYQT